MTQRLLLDRHVPIPMRDGTLLRADIYRPDVAEPAPVDIVLPLIPR